MKGFLWAQISLWRRVVETGQILHPLSVLALGFKYCLIIPVSGPGRLGDILEMAASWSDVVSTVANPAVEATVHKGRVWFLSACWRCWSNELNNLCLWGCHRIDMLIRCRRDSRILDSHQTTWFFSSFRLLGNSSYKFSPFPFCIAHVTDVRPVRLTETGHGVWDLQRWPQCYCAKYLRTVLRQLRSMPSTNSPCSIWLLYTLPHCCLRSHNIWEKSHGVIEPYLKLLLSSSAMMTTVLVY